MGELERDDTLANPYMAAATVGLAYQFLCGDSPDRAGAFCPNRRDEGTCYFGSGGFPVVLALFGASDHDSAARWCPIKFEPKLPS